tara:strand:- start:6698 stop:7624 length:927 start_codon:yes stop_codon:yes gene_type:complete
MGIKSSKYFDILEAKKAFKEGKNVTNYLRDQKNVDINTPEIIETSYDLQSGSYIDFVKKNSDQTELYTRELSSILSNFISKETRFLDIGSGELTTLSYVLNYLKDIPKITYAFDISWSRLFKGTGFAKDILGNSSKSIMPFVAKISEIPLPNKSIDITTSSHALEPNGGNLEELLKELFRVTKDKLVLFEPCYEINSDEGKKRMDSLGYIKNLHIEVEKLGGHLVERLDIKNNENPLNPTSCFIIEPSKVDLASDINDSQLICEPLTYHELKKIENFLYSEKTGLSYPVIKSIPILRSDCCVLTTALS